MKRGMIMAVLVVALCNLFSLTSFAQGVIVYKNDGTRIKIPYNQLDSIATYTYEEGQDDVDENAAVKEYTVGGVTFKMIKVEAGTFRMGSTDGDSDEQSVHSVTLSSDYYIGETEVTQELWAAVMGTNPSYFTSDSRLPVEKVSWNDCQTFITKLNALTGASFRLPTEAEWEFAARGGNKSQGYTYSGSNKISNVAWYGTNSGSKTHVVKTKKPNELGIYDMSGNVYEWCSDWYGSYSSAPVTDPTGPTAGSHLVYRGGSWFCSATSCRCANRNGSYSPMLTYSGIGLRLASASLVPNRGGRTESISAPFPDGERQMW